MRVTARVAVPRRTLREVVRSATSAFELFCKLHRTGVVLSGVVTIIGKRALDVRVEVALGNLPVCRSLCEARQQGEVSKLAKSSDRLAFDDAEELFPKYLGVFRKGNSMSCTTSMNAARSSADSCRR